MRRPRGFKLLEVMIAAALFITVAVLFLNLLPASFWATKKADNLHTSHSIAGSEIEKLRQSPFQDLIVGTSEPVLTRRNGTDFSIVIEVSELPGRDPDLLKKIDVAVSWEERSGLKTTQLTSYISVVKR